MHVYDALRDRFVCLKNMHQQHSSAVTKVENAFRIISMRFVNVYNMPQERDLVPKPKMNEIRNAHAQLNKRTQTNEHTRIRQVQTFKYGSDSAI